MKTLNGVAGAGGNVSETARDGIPHNILREDRGVTVRQARLRIPGRRCIALKWVVQNKRTGKTCTFDNPADADEFLEKEAEKNVFG